VVIYCELDGGYKARERELRGYIDTIFAGRLIDYYDYSPSNQHEWRKALERGSLLTTAYPIIYSGNDDHVFIDYDLDVLYEGLGYMEQEPSDQINTLHFSSWTEAISTVYGLNDFTQRGRYWVADLLYSDAIQVVNPTFFKHVFFDLEMGDAYMRRTDEFLTNWYPTLGDFKYPSTASHPKVKTFVPLRELVRHFDAYWHIGVPLDDCPMLEIPKGFFEGQIDVCLPHSLPLFWGGKISSPYGGAFEPEEITYMRNQAHRRTMIAPHNRGYQHPGVRTPAIATNKWRDFGNGVLPLEERYIRDGFRS